MPSTHVMPRTGRGTAAAKESGNIQPFDWQTAVERFEAGVAGDELDAEYGAPTSGGPPYRVYEIRPAKGFALPIDGEAFAPTRWHFG